MIGSTIQEDAMLWMAPGHTHAKTFWPTGTGQPWPSRSEATPVVPQYDAKGTMVAASGQLLDLHGHCSKGDLVTIMLTIYFVERS